MKGLCFILVLALAAMHVKSELVDGLFPYPTVKPTTTLTTTSDPPFIPTVKTTKGSPTTVPSPLPSGASNDTDLSGNATSSTDDATPTEIQVPNPFSAGNGIDANLWAWCFTLGSLL
ncbi:3338_t:CDS:2, partial [Paraglomus brasilianum]